LIGHFWFFKDVHGKDIFKSKYEVLK
jgi:hypothetical protein